MKIGLVVPVLSNFEQAVDLIYSAKTKENELKVYIQPQYYHQIPLAAAWNNGIKEAIEDGCDYILVSNDDILLAPFSIDQAVQEFNSLDQDYVLYGLTHTPSFNNAPRLITIAKPEENIKFDDMLSQSFFCCFMVRNDFFERCGTFDENFDPCWWEDDDMNYRIGLLDLKVYISRTPMYHHLSQTARLLDHNYVMNKGRSYYDIKWKISDSPGPNRRHGELFSLPYNDETLTPRDWKKL